MKSKTLAILIVDDEPNDREMILRAFRKLGIPNPIRCACSGNDAINYLDGRGDYADRHQFPYPTFIIADLKMPNGDGLSLLQNLKSKPEWAVIPTIILSGSSDADDVKKSFMLGASAFFVKPQRLEQLERMIKVAYEFWSMSETPEVDESGQQLPTKGIGKLGERFPAPDYEQRPRTGEKKQGGIDATPKQTRPGSS